MALVGRKMAFGAVLTAVLASTAGAQSSGVGAPQMVSTPQTAYRSTLSDSDSANLRAALNATNAGAIRVAMDSIQDPLARKIALWALADRSPESMSFFEIDAARRDLNGWPRQAKRQATAEKLLQTSGMAPDRVIAWFGGVEPETVEGAIALAGALRATGKEAEARDLVRRWWREKLFDTAPQQAMRARFGQYLTEEDHLRRADILLYGPQGPAARDHVATLTGPYRQVAEARLGFRSNSPMANEIVAVLSHEQRQDPGLVYEQAAYFRRQGLDTSVRSLARGFKAAPTNETGARIWREDRKRIVVDSLQAGDVQAAYGAAANTGASSGVEASEAEFYAGWIALERMRNPQLAARHFAILANAGTSPLTRSRALYWQGRAAEAQGDAAGAQAFYRQGAELYTTFYGQLAMEKAGMKTLTLPKDPEITQADRARFEGRELVRAARILVESSNRDTFKVFALHIDDTIPTAAEAALLVDLARGYRETDTAMRIVRTAAQRNMILPERGYPLLAVEPVPGAAEPAFVLSITRQESNFDTTARSGADARGMMQLLPATGAMVARKLGESYNPSRLYESALNMRLGSRYLGDMINNFGGSYVMAAAGYNAGPGRPLQWINECGDPRAPGVDPLNFIECIPFSETRNYVMRTTETMMIYRARLNGGSTPLTLASEIKRGTKPTVSSGPQPYISGPRPYVPSSTQ